MKARPVSIVLSLGTALAAAVFVTMAGAPREAAFMSGVFVLAAALWMTEALPLFATSLLVIALQVVLLSNPGNWPGLGFGSGASPSYRQLLATAADPVLLLFFGGFVLARAAVKTGVDRSVSGFLLRPFGVRPRWALLGIMGVTLVFGMWMSNTAITAVMLAFIGPLLRLVPPGDPFRKALVLGVPFAANISGLATPISSPPNAVAIGFLQKAGHPVGFFEWTLMAAPLTVGLIVLTWALLWAFFPPVTAGLRLECPREPLTRPGWIVVATFAATVLLWVTEGWHGLPSAVVAVFPVVVLSVVGIVDRDDLRHLEWNVLILIAGGISLGSGLQVTGLDQVVAHALPQSPQNSVLLISIVVTGTWAVGTFMSNTAAANLFLPIGLSSAAAAGLHPAQVGISIALAASMSMALPMSTPPNAMAYATGEVTSRDMARVSLGVSAVAVATIVLAGNAIMSWAGLLK